jgi:hypothetical protein
MRASFLLLPVLSVVAAFAACTPTVRVFGTGGATTSSSSSSSSSGTGTGGSGGSAPTGTCTPVGAPFTVLNAADFGYSALDDKPVIVADPAQPGHPLVHVIVNATTTGQMVVQSISSNNTMQVANMAIYGGAMYDGGPQAQTFAPVAGWVTPGSQLFVQGSLGGNNPNGGPSGIGQMTFPLDPNQGVLSMPPPSFSPYPTPADCTQPGNVGRMVAIQNGAGVRYATSCNLQNNLESLWLGSDTGAPISIGSGIASDAGVNPQMYAYVGGVNFIGLNANNGLAGNGYVYGPDTALGPFTPLVLQTGQIGIPMSSPPLPTDAGFAFFAASVNMAETSGSLWSGAVQATNLAALAQTPPPGLNKILTASTITDIAPLSHPSYDSTYVYIAGSTLSMADVNFYWFLRDGTPLVVGQNVYTSVSSGTITSTIDAALAAPLSPPTVIVVWIEHDGSSPPVYTVKAQLLDCVTSG